MLVLIVLVAGWTGWRTLDGSSDPAPAVDRPSGDATAGSSPADDGVVIEASGPRAAALADLVSSAQLVVRGRVVATEPGRTVGTPEAPLVTRLVRIEVDEVVAASLDGIVVAPGDRLVVEEEGWLGDGRPVLVNGARGSAEGDVGIFVLVGGDPYLAFAGDQGRLVVDPADERRFLDLGPADPLFDQLRAGDPVWVRHEFQEAAAAAGRLPLG